MYLGKTKKFTIWFHWHWNSWSWGVMTLPCGCKYIAYGALHLEYRYQYCRLRFQVPINDKI